MTSHTLSVQDLTAGYGDSHILTGLDLQVPPGRITVIIGPNACGKSTLLRTMSRLLAPRAGQVLLDGKQVHRTPPRELARVMGLLPQSPIAPEGITVADLVSRGRHPHHGLISRWSRRDDEAVAEALEATRTLELAERPVDELSGGQRQRVWIAMALAQQTDILLLDEPTTFLDIAHQVEVRLAQSYARRGGGVIAVMHDLNLTALYADRVVLMQKGRVAAEGRPPEVLTDAILSHAYGCALRVNVVPSDGVWILPHAAA